jgi:metal-responsive CopG/Arc/MetJ family transcriptional regulator
VTASTVINVRLPKRLLSLLDRMRSASMTRRDLIELAIQTLVEKGGSVTTTVLPAVAHLTLDYDDRGVDTGHLLATLAHAFPDRLFDIKHVTAEHRWILQRMWPESAFDRPTQAVQAARWGRDLARIADRAFGGWVLRRKKTRGFWHYRVAKEGPEQAQPWLERGGVKVRLPDWVMELELPEDVGITLFRHPDGERLAKIAGNVLPSHRLKVLEQLGVIREPPPGLEPGRG